MGSVVVALVLTGLGALGTALGGLLVVLQPNLSFKRLGALQGLAAGLMLSISVMDLLPEAAEEIGFVAANVCFYAGVLFFAAIVALIPEPDTLFFAPSPNTQAATVKSSSKPASAVKESEARAQLLVEAAAASTALAGTAAGSKGVAGKASVLQRASSSSQDSLTQDVQQLPDAGSGLTRRSTHAAAQQQQQQQWQPAAEAAGCSSESGTSADLDVLLLDESDSSSSDAKLKRQLLMSGVITALGIALHNFPEGVAVFLAAQKSPAVGLSLAIAIALHNVPEGVGVALPIYFATGSRWKGLQAAALSGLAEPLAVILLALFFPGQIDERIVDCMLAGVGGIMAFLSFHELLPLAFQHAGKSLAVGCLLAGMGIMSLNLHLLNTYVLGDLH
uniref:Uncharacterized protein n=1 Tax=Tetradesmus obliquus TaxID=3088 RepID=A0A383VEI4_TETOB|eukprot:jgi/Sobl393_1/8470/SZX62786.1